MEEKRTMKAMRHDLAPMSRALLLYYFLLNFMVMLVVSVEAGIRHVLMPSISIYKAFMESIQTNYWGYLLTIVIGLVILLGWKGTDFWKEEIWKPGRAMTAASFFLLFAWMWHVQVFAGVFNRILDWILSYWGLSTANAMAAATANIESTTMFLYVCIGAPIAEELLFRGLILRGFMPYGKKFAIFASALLFGLYHGNLVQIPFAFAMGLILGYAAAEYNIGWSIVLHTCNNMILADTLMRLFNLLPEQAYYILSGALSWGLLIVLVVLTWWKRREIGAWLRQGRLDGRAFGALFQCPSTIILVLITLASMLLSI